MQGEKKGAPVWLWIVVLVPVAVMLLGMFSAVAFYGVRKYVQSAKQEEARAALIEWGEGLASCGRQAGGLPPSSAPVPASLADVAGRKYQSTPAEWQQPAHACARFAMASPQYFQYSWERTSDATGVVHAVADLDGNGSEDASLDLDVTCASRQCQRGTPVDLQASGSASSGTGFQMGPVFMTFFVLCCLVAVVGHVWGVIVAFQVSAGWGLFALCVPFGNLRFLYRYWPQARRPFLLWGGGMVTMLVGAFGWAVTNRAAASGYAAPSETREPAGPRKPAGPRSSSGVLLPPPPPTGPLAALQGEPADLSSVMGRARKLANQWQNEAALLGIEATTLVGAQIQTQDGGSAKVTFGPGSFDVSQPRSGVFVVSYDKNGLSSAPAKGNATHSLPEPMCAPEHVYRRLAGEGQAPVVTLRYTLDAQRGAVWSALLAADPKAKPMAFDRDNCRGLAGARLAH